MIKRILKTYCNVNVWFLCLLVSSAFSPAAQSKTLRFGVDPWPPFVIVEQAQISGIDVDIVRHLADTLNLDLELVRCPFKRCLRMMESGELDMLGSLQKFKDREVYMQYLEPSYYTANKVFYTLKGSEVSINAYQDLERYILGVTLGHKNDPQFDADTRLTKFAAVDTDKLFSLLMKKRIDAALSVDVRSDHYLKTHNLNSDIQKAPFYFKGTQGYLAVSRASGLLERRQEIERMLAGMVNDGTIASMIDAMVREGVKKTPPTR